MCGLTGFSGNKPPDMNKIKIITLFNEIRGKHSNGYYYANQIKKGIDKQAEYSEFIQNNVMIAEEDAKVYIGHVRWATIGAHTEDNAHPFHVKDLILAHNGKIDNIYTLCQKYNIDTKQFIVDSNGLTYLMEQEGLKILNEYKGYAALLFHNLREPDTLYVYHGKSKLKEDGEEIEERPLYMLKTEEGIYFSSMEEPLWAIRSTEDEYPECVEYNRVLKIKAGRIIRTKTVIDRGDLNVTKTHVYTNHNANFGGNSYSDWKDGSWWIDGQKYTSYSEYMRAKNAHELKKSNERIINNINNINNLRVASVNPLLYQETMPLRRTNKAGNFVYFYRGRYWMVENGKQDYLAHGISYIDRKGFVLPDSNSHTKTYYFYAGVMIASEQKYNIMQEVLANPDSNLHMMLTDPKYSFSVGISGWAAYPVTNLQSEGLDVESSMRYNWLLNGKVWTGSLTAKFSDRVYKITNGKLQSISSSLPKDKPLLELKEEKVIDANTEDISKPIILLNQGAPITLPFKEDTEQENDVDIHIFDHKLKNNEISISNDMGEEVLIENEASYPEGVIQMVRTYCFRLYDTKEEFFSEVPATVTRGIELYCEDVVLEETDSAEITEEALKACVDFFLEQMLTDKLSISGNMEVSMSPIEEYVLQAYEEELEDIAENTSKEINISFNFGGPDHRIYEQIEDDDDFHYEKDIDVIDDDVDVIDKAIEENESEKIMEDTLETIKQLRQAADKFGILTHSEMAQRTATDIYRSVDNLIDKVSDRLSEGGKTILLRKIKEINSNI